MPFFAHDTIAGLLMSYGHAVLLIINLTVPRHYAAQGSAAAVLLVLLIVLFVLAARWFWRRRAALAHHVSEIWVRVANNPRLAGFRRRHPKLWTFVAARFARGEYLGLHLTIGFVVSIAALWLFGGVTEDVINKEPLTALDLDIVTWLRAHSTPLLDHVGVAVSLVGSPVTMAALAVIVAIVLLVRRRWIVLSGWLAVFAGGGALDWGLKKIVHRPRPTGASAFLNGQSFSFPSGHAMGSLFGYGMLAYLLVRFWAKTWRQRLTIIVLATALIVSIGLSRLYLGVHYFSDVVAGYAAALVWLATCISGVEITLGRRTHEPWEVGLERRAQPRSSETPTAREITS